MHAALAIRGLQLREEFVVHAALAIEALQVLAVTSLCLFARCSRHRGFAGASGDKFVFTLYLHAALAIGALQVLEFEVHAALASELCRYL